VLARIAFTAGRGVLLRTAPGGEAIVTLPEGTQVYILYQREWVNGQEWIEIQDMVGRTGWVLAMFLSVYP
jgi:hypothetical protein